MTSRDERVVNTTWLRLRTKTYMENPRRMCSRGRAALASIRSKGQSRPIPTETTKRKGGSGRSWMELRRSEDDGQS